MKSKIISLFLLTTILTLAVVSAVTITSTTPADLTKSRTLTNFTITNQGSESVNVQLTALPLVFDDGKSHTITVTTSSPIVYNGLVTGQTTAPINLAYTGDTTNFVIGQYSKNIVLVASQVGNSTNNSTLSVPVKFISTFCKSGETGSNNLSISSVDIRNNDGDDTEWTPLDTISVKVKVENVGDDKVSSTYVEMGLINSDGKNIVSNLDQLTDKKISLSTINSGKEKTAEFTFKIPTDFKEDTYHLVIKTYKSGKEADICTSYSSDLDDGQGYYKTVTGTREPDSDKQVVVDNILSSPEETAQCGDTVQVSADVVNIGDTDYPDQFKVTLYNKDLGVDLSQVVQQDINQGDSYNVDFSFAVPAKVAEKSYDLEFRTYYDYDSDTNKYNEISNKKFLKTIKISGNCQNAASTTPTAQLKISAELDPQTPEAIAGNQVIVHTTLKNLGTTDNTYALSVYGNSAWSSLVSIDPQTVTLAPGQSKDASIVLNVDNAAQGDKEFTIRAAYGAAGDKAVEQKVSLSIASKSSGTDYQSVVNHFKNNWFIYVIVLVNLVLIIAIIVVIRRMVSSPSKEYQ
ncbi:Uncharacterised protein [uncultured archaeon]|nr:Uncharacterised protein [uncultured archaeon]